MAAVGHRIPLHVSRQRLAVAAPWIALGVGSVLVALSATLIAVRINGLGSLDELVYRLSAVTYTDSLPGSIVHDPVARGTARLYSLVLAPIFAAFEGDTALRVARGLNGPLFAASSVPVALLARRLTSSPWAAVAAGLLAVAVPWITVATLLFSEALAYLLFAWALYAMTVTLAAPTPRRDLLVLVLLAALLTTRVQFVGLFAAWLVAVLVVGHGAGTRELRRRHPFLLTTAGLVLLAALVLFLSGRLDQVLEGLGGPYSEIKDRGGPPLDATIAVGYHAGMVVIGLGIVPGVLLLGWLRVALARRAGTEAYRFAVLAVAVTVALFVVAVSAQNGWSDGRAEERYYLYVVPIVWCGAIAALQLRTLVPSTIAWTGIAVTAVLMLVPLNVGLQSSQALYGPVGPSVSWLLGHLSSDVADALGWRHGATPRDVLALIALGLTALTVLLWSRLPRARWTVLVAPALAQLVLAGFALEVIRGDVDGVDGLPLGSTSGRAWVDQALDGDTRATIVENRPLGRTDPYLHLALWNDDVRDRLRAPALLALEPPFPVSNMPLRAIDVGTDLRMSAPPPHEAVVSLMNSPLWQPGGRRIAVSPDGEQELVAVGRAPSVRWLARGLAGDRHVIGPVELALRPGFRATLAIDPPAPDVASRLRVRLGDRQQTVRYPSRVQTKELTMSACGAAGVVRGSLEPAQGARLGDGRRSAAVLSSVRVEPCVGG